MARIELDRIRHSYLPRPQRDEDYALKEVHHSWDDGGAYALLGPSGCGKTTLLNIISGLLHASEGRILFDGRDVSALSTEARNIAQVFQFPVIYDTMTVFDNLAFPLRNRGVAEPEVRRRVAEILKMIDLEAAAGKRARGLTADQKQKIALGRGLVRSDVSAILFDEPLTVIDPLMKWELRSQLKQLHRQFAFTMIYVTHDQTEAMTLGDRVAVLEGGRLQQVAPPRELYERPANVFVAGFIGSPPMNLFPTRLWTENGAARLAIADQVLPCDVGGIGAEPSTAGIRPEELRLAAAEASALRAVVEHVEWLGHETLAYVRLGERDPVRLVARLAGMHPLEKGRPIPLAPAPGALHLFDADGVAIRPAA
jgi:glycerol transport system ATP-binding protein